MGGCTYVISANTGIQATYKKFGTSTRPVFADVLPGHDRSAREKLIPDCFGSVWSGQFERVQTVDPEFPNRVICQSRPSTPKKASHVGRRTGIPR